jgi:predicted lipase
VNKQLIKKAAKYALKAYDEDMDGAIKIENSKTSTTAYIIEHARHQYVVFRGTQQARDWIFNLTAFPWRYSGRWVHGGFMMAHRSVWDKISPHLNPDKEIIFVGHSLGAALAELSAHRCRSLPNVRLITFGKPNVFLRPSKARMKKLKSQVSFVCGSDMVARIPSIGFCPDAGQTLVYFDNWGKTWIDPPESYVRRDRGIGDAISDHDMAGYCRFTANFCDN